MRVTGIANRSAFGAFNDHVHTQSDNRAYVDIHSDFRPCHTNVRTHGNTTT